MQYHFVASYKTVEFPGVYSWNNLVRFRVEMSLTSLAFEAIAVLKQHWLLLIVTLYLTSCIHTKYFHPLSKIPGPFLASFSKLWIIYHAFGGNQHWIQIACHKRYGPVFRAGPNYVLVNDPDYIPAIYKLDRADWFIAFDPKVGKSSLGSVRPMNVHNAQRKRIAAAYSMSSILQMEGYMDVRITELVTQLKSKFASTGAVCDLADWMHWLAFDLVMDLAFGEPVGFVKEGQDVGGLIQSLVELFDAAQVLVTVPSLMKFLNLPWMHALAGPKPTDAKGPGAIQGIADRAVHDRIAGGNKRDRRDLLQRFMEYRDADGSPLTSEDLEIESVTPVVAGSDTSATAMRAAILYIYTNFDVYHRLMAEIDTADKAGKLSTPCKYNEIKDLPYLTAVIREVLRIYPPIGTPFPRLVPEEGMTVSGHHLPKGSEIGISMWCISRNEDIYGSDACVFKPERWLESEEKTRYYDKVDTVFGAGYNTCIGKNLAILEVHKTIVELLRNFEISIQNPEKPWKSHNALMFLQSEFKATIKARVSSG
jgi:cytochrome P450